MAGFIPNSVLDNMVNMIRDYDDHHRGTTAAELAARSSRTSRTPATMRI